MWGRGGGGGAGGRKALKMNEAQLPEVTNVPNDLCAAQVALFLPSRGTAVVEVEVEAEVEVEGLLVRSPEAADVD